MKALNNVSMKDKVAEALRKEIYSGNIPNGEEITQEDISAKLGVSRMPIREAFLQLQNEGLLERLPNRHMKVIGISSKMIKEQFLIISAIETQIATLALENNLKKDMIKRALEKYNLAVANKKQKDIIEEEIEFHLIFSQIIESKNLYQLHQRELNGYYRYVLANFLRESNRFSHILNHIAVAFLENDLEKLKENIYSYYKEITSIAIKESCCE